MAYYVDPMVKSGDEQKVRTVPVEPRPTERGSERVASESANRHETKRRWIPATLLTAAVTGLVTAVFVSGAIEVRDDPAPPPGSFAPDSDSTEIYELPSSLADALPFIEDSLTVVATNGAQVSVFYWEPSFRIPSGFSMTDVADVYTTTAAFDRSSSMLWLRDVRFSENSLDRDPSNPPQLIASTTRLLLAPPYDVAQHEPILRRIPPKVQAAVWHTSEAERIAFLLATDLGTTLEILTVQTGVQRSPVQIVATGLPESIVRVLLWDNSGFVLDLGDTTVAMDMDGEVQWSLDAQVLVATNNRIVVTRTDTRDPEWRVVERSTGIEISLDGLGMENDRVPDKVVVWAERDLIAVSIHRPTGTALTITSDELGAPRLLHLDGMYGLIQFVSGGDLLVLSDDESGDLLFLNWRTGAQHSFPIPEGYDVLAVAAE